MNLICWLFGHRLEVVFEANQTRGGIVMCTRCGSARLIEIVVPVNSKIAWNLGEWHR